MTFYAVVTHSGITGEHGVVLNLKTTSEQLAKIIMISTAISLCNDLSREYLGVNIRFENGDCDVYIGDKYLCNYSVVSFET